MLIPESAKTENGDSPAEQLADLVPKKNQEEYYSITQYVNDINRENTEVLMELKTDGTANASYTYGYSRNSRDTAGGASYYLYDGRGRDNINLLWEIFLCLFTIVLLVSLLNIINNFFIGVFAAILFTVYNLCYLKSSYHYHIEGDKEN